MTHIALKELISYNQWADIPENITTREGHTLDTSTNIWNLPYSLRTDSQLDFNLILNSSLQWVTKRYVQEKIQITSTHAGYSTFQDIWREVFKFQRTYKILSNTSSTQIKSKLIDLLENKIALAKAEHRLWAFYRTIQWYVWCAENYPELGFCPAYALELDSMIVPGNPKGEAVRMEDPDSGPLHRLN